MSDGYWVDRVEGLDDPTPIIREALEKSIQEGSLNQFNTELKALVKRDKNGHILESTPLELVPLLLLANETITVHPQPLQESYELIARHGSPKEILLVVQESLDALLQEAKELENDEESASSTPTQIIWKWLRLIDMYSLSFPRLVPRKRSAPETAAPIIQHLRDSFNNLAVLVDTNEPASQEIVEACIRLGYSLLGWFEAVGSEVNEVAGCKMALKELLCVALAECLSDKHILRSYDDFLHRIRTAGLDFTPTYAIEPRSKMTGSTRTQSIGEFVLYYLSNQGPTALGAINDCVLGGLYEEEFLEEDIAAEMIPVVSTPASTDPDSKSRAVLFNLLTQMILKVQPVHAFKFVRDLASEECPYLNMRSSAIGLLRRLVVRAFNRSPQAEDDPFASRLLLEEYKHILFQSPILEKKEAGPESIDAQEMNRLVEILGFFYVLLARDKNNLTGVRDTKGTQELRDRIVDPLKAISSELESTSEDPSVLFSVRSISVSLERIEEIVSGIEDRSI
ncbi:hypothetical protein BN14_11723 [Rhizoctonia solani AG-1 IB]|uniref:Uncharacterized protein n=1 Tax=Thanatephorus cucumeris (strain AG1-IB / isolate 7/3/14) TaxID=1108050 RepID=M5CHB3_THACB|nr:hypothetical protein BN14_11723 [Rhizoctonia solani AG-1 IB]